MASAPEACLIFFTGLMLVAGICMAICVFLVLDVDKEKSERTALSSTISTKGLNLEKIHKKCGCPDNTSLKYQVEPQRRSSDLEGNSPQVFRTDLLEGAPNNTKIFQDDFRKEEEKKTRDRKVAWKYHRNLLSLSVQKDPNDPDFITFECAGFALNQSFALVVRTCVDKPMLSTIRLRHLSRYWSVEGDEYVVNKIIPIRNLALLTVVPFLKIPETFLIGSSVDLNWNKASSAGWIWDDRIYSTYGVNEWKSRACPNCSEAEVVANATCKGSYGDPLVVDDVLIGLRSCGNEFVAIS